MALTNGSASALRRSGEDLPSSPSRLREESAAAPGDEALLACLVHVCEQLGKPTTAERILRGLPLTGGTLPLGLFERAAGKAGLVASIVKRPLSRLSDLVLPCILLLRDGGACVLAGRSGGSCQLVYPHRPEVARTLQPAALKKLYSGHAILLTPQPEAPAETGMRRPGPRQGHWFWAAIRQLWPNYAQIVLAAFLINLLALAVPLFTMNVYDRVIPNLAITTLWALASGVVLALAFDFLLKMVRAHVIERTARRVDMAVSATIFEKVMAISMRDRRGSAGGLANQIKEFETIAEFLSSSTVVALTDLAFIGIFGFVLWLIVGPLVLIPIAAVPLVLLATLIVQWPLRRAIHTTQGAASSRHSVLVESLAGIEAVKASTAEGHMQRHWERAIAAGGRSMTRTRFWSALATNFTALVQQSASVIIIIWGVYLVAEGSITVGALIAAMILSGRIFAPLGNISTTLAQLQRSSVAMRSIGEIMALCDESQISAEAYSRKVTSGAIEFRKVGFSYPGGEIPALRDVSFTIHPGERVGIVGRVGSGKTTIGRLIAGLYAADDGLVLVDDFDVRQYHPADLRRAIGFATQDPELFTGTLRDNIAIGLGDHEDGAIDEAGRLAGVDDFAGEHPLGYNMPVSERGRSLSGGQRQAVALARLLARKPKVLFLDEPSSAMDTRSEQVLVQRLKEITDNGSTVLISTHRSSLLHLVDRLLVFEKGKLKLDGPRDKVMRTLAQLGTPKEE